MDRPKEYPLTDTAGEAERAATAAQRGSALATPGNARRQVGAGGTDTDAAGEAERATRAADRGISPALPGVIVPHSAAEHGSAGAGRDSVVDAVNLLLGLAWLGEAGTGQVQRLWFHHRAGRSGWRGAWRVLRELHAEGYVERRAWAVPRPGGGPPIRRDLLWSLSKAGRDWLGDHDQFPPKLLPPRSRRMIPHDVMTTETIVRMIELGRDAGLSGVYLEREVRLDPARTRPVMDALVILRTGGGFDGLHSVPWTKDPRAGDERRRRYALENDRNSEPLSVIIGKAHAYRQAGTATWVERYGSFPIPVWVVPSERRARAIMQAWAGAWPDGKWLITTDAELQHDRWTEYYAGRVRQRGLFRSPAPAGPTDQQRST